MGHNGQRVYFMAENVADIVANLRDNTLIASFELYAEDPFVRTLLYCEVPIHYTWANKKFSRRKQDSPIESYPEIERTNALDRVYTVYFSYTKCFYSRILRHKVKGGPTPSIQSLRTYVTGSAAAVNSFRGVFDARATVAEDGKCPVMVAEETVCPFHDA